MPSYIAPQTGNRQTNAAQNDINVWYGRLMKNTYLDEGGVSRDLTKLENNNFLFYIDDQGNLDTYNRILNLDPKAHENTTKQLYTLAEQGRLFVRPMGKTELSQIQVGEQRNSPEMAEMGGTFPTPVRPAEVPKVRFHALKRFASIFTRRYDEELNNWKAADDAMKKYERESGRIEKLNQKLEELKGKIGPEEMNQEKAARKNIDSGLRAKNEKEQQILNAEEAEKQRLGTYYDKMQKARGCEEHFRRFDRHMDGIMGPNAGIQWDLVRKGVYDPRGEKMPTKGYGKFMENLRTDLDKQHTKNSGTTLPKNITDRQMGCLALIAMGAKEANKNTKVEHGSTKEVQIHHNYSFIMENLFTHDPRENTDKFGNVLTEARRFAREAVMDYVKGKPDKLASLIAQGLKQNNTHLQSFEGLNAAYAQVGVLGGEILDFLEQDPNLLDAVQKKGITDEDLNVARGAKAIANLYRDGMKAQQQLIEGAAAGKMPENANELVAKIYTMECLNQEIITSHANKQAKAGAGLGGQMEEMQAQVAQLFQQGKHDEAQKLLDQMTHIGMESQLGLAGSSTSDIINKIGKDPNALQDLQNQFLNMDVTQQMAQRPVGDVVNALCNGPRELAGHYAKNVFPKPGVKSAKDVSMDDVARKLGVQQEGKVVKIEDTGKVKEPGVMNLGG